MQRESRHWPRNLPDEPHPAYFRDNQFPEEQISRPKSEIERNARDGYLARRGRKPDASHLFARESTVFTAATFRSWSFKSVDSPLGANTLR
jgi:hypothetical protein